MSLIKEYKTNIDSVLKLHKTHIVNMDDTDKVARDICIDCDRINATHKEPNPNQQYTGSSHHPKHRE